MNKDDNWDKVQLINWSLQSKSKLELIVAIRVTSTADEKHGDSNHKKKEVMILYSPQITRSQG